MIKGIWLLSDEIGKGKDILSSNGKTSNTCWNYLLATTALVFLLVLFNTCQCILWHVLGNSLCLYPESIQIMVKMM